MYVDVHVKEVMQKIHFSLLIHKDVVGIADPGMPGKSSCILSAFGHRSDHVKTGFVLLSPR
jgi:hypothetical protein